MTIDRNAFEQPQELEARLQQFQPIGMPCNEAEVLYRCGWEAALESLRKSAGSQPSTAVSGSSRAFFLSGLVSGMAAAVLLYVSISIPTLENAPVDLAIAPALEESQEFVVPSERATGDEPGTSEELATKRNQLNFLASILDWRSPILTQDHSSTALGFPSAGGAGALSTVARNRWAAALETPGNTVLREQEVHAVKIELPPRSRTLGEMLLELSADEYF